VTAEVDAATLSRITRLEGELIRVQHYGAVGNGTTDDTAALQDAVNAWTQAQRATLLFQPNRSYRITDTIAATATGHIQENLTISGYGARIICSDVASGAAMTLSCGDYVWRNWILEGLYFDCPGTGADDILRIEDGGTGFMYGFKIRDIAIEGGSHSASGLQLAGLTGGGLFEFQVENVHVDFTGNDTGYCVQLQSDTGITTSSADFYAIETRGGANGLRIGSNTVAQRVNVIGGTFLLADAEGIVAYVQGGNFLHPHIEACQQGAASLAAGGAGMYLEGWANIVNLEDFRSVDQKQKWALDVYAYGGPTNIVGMPAGFASYPFVRVRSASPAGGLVNLIGIPPNEIDVSAVTEGAVSPQVYTSVLSGRQSLTYGTAVATDASLGNYNTLRVTNGTAFTMSNPSNFIVGQELSYSIENLSGGAMGAITWDTYFMLAGAFTNPANTKRRTISFVAESVDRLVEKCRAAADI
jgi:hypothetical protein